MNLACDPEPVGARHIHLFSNFTVGVTNLNGWDTVPERLGFKGQLAAYHVYVFKMFRRHHLSVVGVVEHHLHDVPQVQSAQHWARGHGYTFVCNRSLDAKSGVGLLHDNKWLEVRSCSVGTRLLVVVVTPLINFRWPLSWGIYAILPTAQQLSGRPWVILLTGLMNCR